MVLYIKNQFNMFLYRYIWIWLRLSPSLKCKMRVSQRAIHTYICVGWPKRICRWLLFKTCAYQVWEWYIIQINVIDSHKSKCVRGNCAISRIAADIWRTHSDSDVYIVCVCVLSALRLLSSLIFVLSCPEKKKCLYGYSMIISCLRQKLIA